MSECKDEQGAKKVCISRKCDLFWLSNVKKRGRMCASYPRRAGWTALVACVPAWERAETPDGSGPAAARPPSRCARPPRGATGRRSGARPRAPSTPRAHFQRRMRRRPREELRKGCEGNRGNWQMFRQSHRNDARGAVPRSAGIYALNV